MTELPVIVFDVNETLLDLESLTPTFERIFGDRLALRRWFAELILYSEALTLAGIYVPFTDIGGAVLKMVATTCGISISAADRAELTEKFASMPAHPEVPDALAKLKHAGFRLCTLTNNTAEISGRQLQQAGLLDLFERRFSVDDVRRHKPAPEVYASVARALQTQPSDICLVACHTWDTLGAVAAGWEARSAARACVQRHAVRCAAVGVAASSASAAASGRIAVPALPSDSKARCATAPAGRRCRAPWRGAVALDRAADLAQRGQHHLGVVRVEQVVDLGRALAQAGEQQHAVGDALRAGQPHRAGDAAAAAYREARRRTWRPRRFRADGSAVRVAAWPRSSCHPARASRRCGSGLPAHRCCRS